MTTRLRQRMIPLYVAASLQAFNLWVPVEKLFMSEIGFDAAAVGLMAAAYAAVVPIVEVPSGLLADRWSRRGVLMLATGAIALSSLVGGLSSTVPVYIVGALILGLYFAMYSGTMESVVYDTVLEETGSSALYEKQLGRLRIVEAVSLAGSSLLGGVLADLLTPRATYFLTIPVTVLSLVAFLRFREPQLHKANPHPSIRAQIAVTYRAMLGRRRLLPIVALTLLTSMILQVVFEFGPLWLLALSAAAVVYGPYWAAVVSSLGLGGLVAGKLRLDRPLPLVAVGVALVLATVVLTTSHHLGIVAVAQVVLAILVVVLGIYAARLLHDDTPSEVRAGVASGVGALSWIAFLPFSLVFGVVSKANGVHTAGWMITAAAVLVVALLVIAARRTTPAEPATSRSSSLVGAGEAA